MKKILSIIAFATGAPLVILVSGFILLNVSQTPSIVPQVLGASSESSPLQILPEIHGQATTSDARPVIIKKYLTRYNSPLVPYAETIVQTSDKYSLDYRLLVAIAQQESNLCKKIPENSHNCWGFGIYGTLVTRFDNYPQAMETVAKTLKKQYLDKGLDTPEKIMAKYTPPSQGSWAKGVSQFLDDLE